MAFGTMFCVNCVGYRNKGEFDDSSDAIWLFTVALALTSGGRASIILRDIAASIVRPWEMQLMDARSSDVF